jgi:hypothetical protein
MQLDKLVYRVVSDDDNIQQRNNSVEEKGNQMFPEDQVEIWVRPLYEHEGLFFHLDES